MTQEFTSQDLYQAVENNNIEQVLLISKKCSDLIASEIGLKALDSAVENNLHDIVEILIDIGVSMTSYFDLYESPLRSLVKVGDRRMLDLILKKGLDFKPKRKCDENSDLAVESMVDWVTTHNDIDFLKYLLANGFDIKYAERCSDSMICSLIEKSVFKAESEELKLDQEAIFPMIEFLVHHGVDINSGRYGSPLSIAFSNRLSKIVSKLVELGANFDTVKTWVFEGYQGPLYRVIESGISNGKWVPKAIEVTDLSKLSPHPSLNPVVKAIEKKDIDSIKLVIEGGANKNAFDTERRSYLTWALGYKYNYFEEESWSDKKTSVKKPSPKAIEIMEYFIGLGLDLNVINAGDINDKTPLDYCSDHSELSEIKKKLIAMGAKTYEDLQKGKFASDVLLKIANNVDRHEAWIEYALEDLNSYSDSDNQLWFEFICNARAINSNKPTKKLTKVFAELLEGIGKEKYQSSVLQWFHEFKNKRLIPLRESLEGQWHTSQENANLAKWLIHFCTSFNDRKTARALRDVAIVMYKKVPGHGSRNARIANAAVQALSEMDLDVGAKEIVILRSSIKYSAARKNVDKIFTALAEKHQISIEELELLGLSDYGMSSLGYLEKDIGGYTGILTVESFSKVSLRWKDKDGKEQKSIPAKIKDKCKKQINELKDVQKDIKKSLSAQIEMTEGFFVKNPSNTRMSFSEWKENYIEHPLLGLIGRNLIWQFSLKGKKIELGIFFEGQIVDIYQTEIAEGDVEQVELWHPITSEPDVVVQWQSYILNNEISQPFKQAYREIYRLPVDGSEQKQVDDFAGHMLFPNVLHAVATGRKWKQVRGGAWDGGSEIEATKTYKDYSIMAYFDIEPDEEAGSELNGMHYAVRSKQLSFLKQNNDNDYEDFSEEDRYYQGDAVSLSLVPQIIYSETMRDIDIFISSANVFHQKNWDNPNSRNQWIKECFGELSESGIIRKQVLSELLPKLAISKKVKIEDRFLYVEGKLKTYKVHIGSACILMEPGDKYLCIVKSQNKAKKIFLPFEGDGMLSEILSKAMLLAADDKIKDETIASQII